MEPNIENCKKLRQASANAGARCIGLHDCQETIRAHPDLSLEELVKIQIQLIPKHHY